MKKESKSRRASETEIKKKKRTEWEKRDDWDNRKRS